MRPPLPIIVVKSGIPQVDEALDETFTTEPNFALCNNSNLLLDHILKQNHARVPFLLCTPFRQVPAALGYKLQRSDAPNTPATTPSIVGKPGFFRRNTVFYTKNDALWLGLELLALAQLNARPLPLSAAA